MEQVNIKTVHIQNVSKLMNTRKCQCLLPPNPSLSKFTHIYTFNKSSRFSINSQFEGINRLEIRFAAANPQMETESSGLNTGTARRQAPSFAKA
jgi:hypothetical protein